MLFFQGEWDPKRIDVRSWYEAAKGQARMWIVGLSRFVIVFVLRPLLQDEPELQPDEEGLVARALGGPVLGAGGAQEEQGRTLQVCLSTSPNTLSTYVFI